MERHVQTLAHELARTGHHVDVVTLGRPGLRATGLDGDVRVHRVTGWSRVLIPFYEDREHTFHPPVPDPGVVASLGRILDRVAPDVIHAHGWILYSALGGARRAGVPVLATLHDHGLACAKKSWMRGGQPCTGPSLRRCLPCAARHYGTAKGAPLTIGLRAARRLHGRADHYLAVSSAVARTARPVSGAEVTVVPNFVPDALVDATAGAARGARPAFVPAGGDYVLFAGALAPHKGLDVLLTAWRRDPPAPLVLAGPCRAGDEPRLPRLVRWAGAAPHDQVMAAFAHASVAVVPSVWPEPMATVVVEAMAAGAPVVASDIGGMPDMVSDGVDGVLVPAGDPAALRRAVADLLADPARRAALSAAGRVRAGQLTVSNVAPRIVALYERALATHDRAPTREVAP
jgi:glycosyltransferase involved in cell wall biosynthesis